MLVSNASARPDCPIELIDVDHAEPDLLYLHDIWYLYKCVFAYYTCIYIYIYDMYRYDIDMS